MLFGVRLIVDVPRFFSDRARVEIDPEEVVLGPPIRDAETI
jgi:hypothetical protein